MLKLQERSISRVQRLGILRPPMPWHRPHLQGEGDELVICMHGLWRSVWAMEHVAKSLTDAGYACINMPYPSFREPLDALAARLADLVDAYADDFRSVHFVTHSLGGVVVRRYLAQSPHPKCGRVMMIAPPLLGSRIVDYFQHSPLRYALGPAGTFLSSASMTKESNAFTQRYEVAVIMGNVVKIPWLHRLIQAESDGIVRVESGWICGLKEFCVIPADHTLITCHPEVLSKCVQFLKQGKFV